MFTPPLLVQILAALLSSAAVSVPHPHYTKVIVMPGAGGNVSFTYSDSANSLNVQAFRLPTG